MFFDLFKHDLRATIHWKSGHPSANSWESHRRELLLNRALQAIDRGVPQATLVGEAPQVHAGCVDHVAGLELSTAGNGCLSQRDRTEQVTFLLNRRSPFASDCASH